MQKLIDNIEHKNMNMVQHYDHFGGVQPHVLIVHSNTADEASNRYIKNKVSKFLANGILSTVVTPENDMDLILAIQEGNVNDKITSIIVQAPLGDNITLSQQSVFDAVLPEKDIDRLGSCWVYSKFPEDLPLTALGIYKLIHEYPAKSKVLFFGNGITTNRRLFPFMLDEGVFNCRIVNSKTPENEKRACIDWADIIVASTGKAEILKCVNKIVISPTIVRCEDGFKSDLDHSLRSVNRTHNVLNAIGKLTVSEMLKRAYTDVVPDDI